MRKKDFDAVMQKMTSRKLNEHTEQLETDDAGIMDLAEIVSTQDAAIIELAEMIANMMEG